MKKGGGEEEEEERKRIPYNFYADLLRFK